LEEVYELGFTVTSNYTDGMKPSKKNFTLNLVTIVIVIYVKASGNCYIPNPAQALDSYAFSLLILISSPSVIGGVAAA
jgi:hypothetical protein